MPTPHPPVLMTHDKNPHDDACTPTACAERCTAPLSDTQIDARVVQARTVCQQAGVRFTPLREQVYRLILQTRAPIGAYELLAQLQAVTDKPVAPPTIYRSLDFLLAHGLIHQLSSTKAFFACCQPDGEHTAAFLICQQCGTVQEFSEASTDVPIDALLRKVAAQADFSIKTRVIELSGLCAHCQR
ncbi:Fur family transcriptional regulator [Faucicola atlantae]|uniref:Fur family transcriptional regulator n=1 Tax=Faucicola atlantae TaxID=34059 RepID=UPI0009F44339|nr:transcriptional repressor [Moraxella atlantae]